MAEIKLIDFEYAAFGPEEYDLANIFNEMIIDNNFAYYPFIRGYYENCLSIEEVKAMMRQYLLLKYEYLNITTETKESYLEAHMDFHLRNFFRCALLNNLYWGVWAVLLIKEKNINDDVFNFGYVSE